MKIRAWNDVGRIGVEPDMKTAFECDNVNLTITENVLTIYWKKEKKLPLMTVPNLVSEFNKLPNIQLHKDKFVDQKHKDHDNCHNNNPKNNEKGFQREDDHSHIRFNKQIEQQELFGILDCLRKTGVINNDEVENILNPSEPNVGPLRGM